MNKIFLYVLYKDINWFLLIFAVVLHAEDVDWNINGLGQAESSGKSSSMRRTWIEMFIGGCRSHTTLSRPPCGGRGLKFIDGCFPDNIALSSSMRRTWIEIQKNTWQSRQLVGRPPCGGRGLKYENYVRRIKRKKSSSMRRTWIEISKSDAAKEMYEVVLHAEDVDWNVARSK